MKVGEALSLSEHLYAALRGLREMAICLIRQISDVGCWYQGWAPVRLPGSVQSVLFVCKGNICRSPLAAVYFRSIVEKMGRRMAVHSAGLETTPGKPAHAKAKAVASQYCLSLDEHTATQVYKELLDQSDLVIVMEIVQKVRIQRLYPSSKGKVVLLGRFDSVGFLEIADPYGGTSEEFHSCFQQVTRCCDVLVARLGVKSGEPAMGQVLPDNARNL